MTKSNRRANAAEEWRLAERFLAAGDHLADAGMWDRATSQLYFAVFHAVRALLLADGLQPRSHSGARHLLHVHFVVPGRLARSHHRLLHELQDEREGADYVVAYPNDRERYSELRVRAGGTLAVLRDLALGEGGAEPD